jgi:integrase
MKPSRAMTERQFKALIRAAASRRYVTAARDRFLFYFLGNTGLRITEALSLQVRDLYLDADPAFLRVVTIKRRRPCHDEVYLDANTARLVRFYVSRTLPQLYAASVASSEAFPGPACPLFLAGRRGRIGGAVPRLQAMSRRNASWLFRTYARLAGLPPTIVLHSLRHYRGTMLLRRTADLEFTRAQMRHRSLRTTAVYQHADPDRVAGYLNKLEEP